MRQIEISALTAETILGRAVFEWIYETEDEIDQAEKLVAVMPRVKELGVKSSFETLLRGHVRERKKYLAEKARFEREQTKQNSSGENMTRFGYDKIGELFCGDWQCGADGVWRHDGFGRKCVACGHPVLPVKRLVNIHTNEEKMVIAFNKDGSWKELTFGKDIIANANMLCKQLPRHGILVTSETAKQLERYFYDMEQFNLRDIPLQKSVSRMGWLDGYNSFIPFDNGDVEFDSENQFSYLYDSITSKGSREKYMSLLLDIRRKKRREPMMCVAASLASVLVKPCGVLPFIFHLYGEAGKGKSVSTMLAAAIWGNPNEGGYMADPKNTANAFEACLDFLNNLPFICDDMSKLKVIMQQQKKDYGDFIYFLCGGTGKGRSNTSLGLNKLKNWSNCSITNAERPLTGELSNGGELLRVIEMQTAPGIIFDDGTMGKTTAVAVRENYGFLGREFIDAVRRLGVERVREIHETFAGMLTSMDKEKDKEGKQIQSMALIMAADYIFTQEIARDGVFLDYDYCFSLLRSYSQMNENERAYEFIVNELRIHHKAFGEGEFEPVERWGYIKNGFWLVNPKIFAQIASEGNFNKKMFIEWAVGKGLSEVNAPRQDKRARIGKTNYPYVFVKMPADDLEEVDIDSLPE